MMLGPMSGKQLPDQVTSRQQSAYRRSERATHNMLPAVKLFAAMHTEVIQTCARVSGG